MPLTKFMDSLRRRRALRIAGLAFGVLCLAGAVAMVVRERTAFAEAWGKLRDPPMWELALVLLSIAVGSVLTATLFHLLMRRFGRVPFGEMLLLMTASSFANYLPLKPGLLGRVAYHRVRHGIRPTDTVRTILEAIALSGTVAGLFLLALAALRALQLPGEFALVAPSVVAIAGIMPRLRTIALALLLRQAEFTLLAFRYWVIFRLIGAPIDLEAAIVLASVNAIATLVPFVSSGLGVREWMTGLITPLVSPDTFSQGLVAELVHRVAEIVVIAPLGTLSLAMLTARIRRAPTDAANAPPSQATAGE